MAGRKVVSEQEAQRYLAAARSAGSTPGAWARAHGIDGRSLNAWRVNLGRRGATVRVRREPTRLVELVPVASAAPVVSRARYIVRVGGAELEVGDNFDGTTVRRLVLLLKSC
jgi:hypothetical protein